MNQFRPFHEGNFVAGVDTNVNECRAKTYLDADVLIQDFAIRLAPELFPDKKGMSFTRSS